MSKPELNLLDLIIDWLLKPPKLKWLKDKLPASWQRSRKAFDLSDFMVYKVDPNPPRIWFLLVGLHDLQCCPQNPAPTP